MSNPQNVNPELPSRLTQRSAALVELDILNCRSIAISLGSEKQFAMFIDGFYTLCSEATRSCGGEVIKYMGDSCLTMFDEAECVAALDSVNKVRQGFPALCETFGLNPTGVRATVHTGSIVVGEFGPEGQKDVTGKMASELFQTVGRGITITEQVYRKLPNDRRAAWKKTGGQVVYTMK